MLRLSVAPAYQSQQYNINNKPLAASNANTVKLLTAKQIHPMPANPEMALTVKTLLRLL